MTSWRKATLYGIVVWLLPFAVAFAIYPIKESNRPLFESIMPLVVALAVVVFGVRYLRQDAAVRLREGVLLGLVWLAISVLIDLPLLLSPPISMHPLDYAADIGLTYVMMPMITAGLAAMSPQRNPETQS